jgi:peptidoglycan/xylan/chitin deacetylase (PgdA/CDA1 family)
MRNMPPARQRIPMPTDIPMNPTTPLHPAQRTVAPKGPFTHSASAHRFLNMLLCLGMLLALPGILASTARCEQTQKTITHHADPIPGSWGQAMPGIVSRIDAQAIALTFDLCGGSYDACIIALLRQENIPATLFIASPWLRKHGNTLQELAADPLFEIAAHGLRHVPCSVDGKSAYGIRGTTSLAAAIEEAEGCARELAAAIGRKPAWFRSGTAFYDAAAVHAINDRGLRIAGYSIAGDQGATLPADKVAARTLNARPGDILLFHANHPGSGTCAGLAKALPVLKSRGVAFVRLSDALPSQEKTPARRKAMP